MLKFYYIILLVSLALRGSCWAGLGENRPDLFPQLNLEFQETFFLIEEQLKAHEYALAMHTWNETLYNQLRASKFNTAELLVEYPLNSKSYLPLAHVLENLGLQLFLLQTPESQKHGLTLAQARLQREMNPHEKWVYFLYAFSPLFTDFLEKQMSWSLERGLLQNAYHLATQLKLQQQTLDYRDRSYAYVHELALWTSLLSFQAQAPQEIFNYFEEHNSPAKEKFEMHIHKQYDFVNQSIKELTALDNQDQKIRDRLSYWQRLNESWHPLSPQWPDPEDFSVVAYLKECEKRKNNGDDLHCLDLQKLALMSPGVYLEGKVYFLMATDLNDDKPYKLPIPGFSWPGEWDMLRNDQLFFTAVSWETGELICQVPVAIRHYGLPYALEGRYYPYNLSQKEGIFSFATEFYVAHLSSDCSIKRVTLNESPGFNQNDQNLQNILVKNVTEGLSSSYGTQYFALDQGLILIQYNHPKKEVLKLSMLRWLPTSPDFTPISSKFWWLSNVNMHPFEIYFELGKVNLLPLILEDIQILAPRHKLVIQHSVESINWELRLTALKFVYQDRYRDSMTDEFLYTEFVNFMKTPNFEAQKVYEIFEPFVRDYLMPYGDRGTTQTQKLRALEELGQLFLSSKDKGPFEDLFIQNLLFEASTYYLSDSGPLGQKTRNILWQMAQTSLEQKSFRRGEIRWLIKMLLAGKNNPQLMLDYLDLVRSELMKVLMSGDFNEANHFYTIFKELSRVQKLTYMDLMRPMANDLRTYLFDPRQSSAFKKLALELFESENTLRDLAQIALEYPLQSDFDFYIVMRNRLYALDPKLISPEAPKVKLAIERLEKIVREALSEDEEMLDELMPY